MSSGNNIVILQHMPHLWQTIISLLGLCIRHRIFSLSSIPDWYVEKKYVAFEFLEAHFCSQWLSPQNNTADVSELYYNLD
jgi:hypothetical protein